MVNASWTARPPIPAVHSRVLAAIPRHCQTQTPSAPPAGFLVFGPLPATVLGSYHRSFGAGDRGLGSPGCRALRHTMPRLDSAEPLVRFSRAALPSADSPRASLRGSTLIASPA